MTKASKSGNLYLVEHYSPGLTVDGLASLAACVRATAVAMGKEGRAVRYLRSTIVPADEALLCVFEASSEELVREVYARAGLPFERLSAAIADETEWLDSEPPPGAGGAEGTAQRSTERESHDKGKNSASDDRPVRQETRRGTRSRCGWRWRIRGASIG